jgi:hypothetical protein
MYILVIDCLAQAGLGADRNLFLTMRQQGMYAPEDPNFAKPQLIHQQH